MSTFKGYVAEFPRIRIDYFRKNPDQPPPLACFLSHVHSDHLQGLESRKAPFVYCSPATRELLLRIEKYPHRMNFAKGILETRKQHYRHLKNLLKTIPLETPTEIELGPQAQLRVTLFDANHCSGAVMFLIEGDGKAILYTGDIRSEPWWVNSLVRNPVLIPYTLGNRRLDKIYLDTTFAEKTDPYRAFPSKAQGLNELLTQVARYPASTTFHMNSWTLGYEDVWIALAAAVGSQVHVDRYKMGLYRSLTTISGDGVGSHEGPALCGYKCGNRRQEGCLTNDQSVRLHSCERGTECSGVESQNVVWITPIITRTSTGADVPELGAGGGGGDLNQIHELELSDTATVGRLITLCSTQIKDSQLLAKVITIVSSAMASDTKTLSLGGKIPTQDEDGNISLLCLTEILSRAVESRDLVPKMSKSSSGHRVRNTVTATPTAEQLPRHIRFPYSRHSSYDELCHLVEIFKPKDVYPCTTDNDSWHECIGVEALFGHLCSGSTFVHDQEMKELEDERVVSRDLKRKRNDSSQEYCTQEPSQGEDGSGSDPEVTLVKETLQPGRLGTPGGKRQRLSARTMSQGHTNEPNEAVLHRPASSIRLPYTSTASIQQAFEQLPGTEDTTEPRLESPSRTLKSQKYRCAWRHCSCSFQTIGTLRHHVVLEHSLIVTRKGEHAYYCLWHSCPHAKTLYFTSLDMWEAHLNETHYPAEVKRVLGETKGVGNREAAVESQQSLPSPPVEDREHDHIGLQAKLVEVIKGTQEAPAQSRDASEPLYDSNRESSDDITLIDVIDRNLRKQVSKMATELGSSLIMARTILLAKGYEPLRDFYLKEYERADDRARYEPAAYQDDFKQFATKIHRLRKVLPTADELTCLEALRKHKGRFREARDGVASSEQRRLAEETDSGDETDTSDGLQTLENPILENDQDDTSSLLSLRDSDFNSQTSSPCERPHHTRLEHRKQAYKAARGLDGLDWAPYSPVSAGNNHTEKELEL